MPAPPESRRWAAAGVATVVLVFLSDRLTPPDVALVTLLAFGPLIAAAGAGRRATLVVAVLATALALLAVVLDGRLVGQEGVRLATVAVVSALAVVLASLRERLEQRSEDARAATRRGEETLALLDVIFARSPVGLGFHDLDGRFVRINDHLAEINGRSPAEHLGRTLEEILPELPAAGADVRRVARTGEPATQVELRGQTPAQPGVEREWVASYWPVRAQGGELIGVGTVVFDVTDRRRAERALRTQTDRYETLLTALSEVGEGMVVIEDGRCVYANHAFEQLSGYTFPELASMESLFALVEPEERAEAERRARVRTEQDVVDTTYTLAMRRRDGSRVTLELAGVPLEIAGTPARRQLVVVVRDVTARRRAEAERERLLRRSALLAEASALFDQSLDEERTLRSVAELCVRDVADTCVVVLGAYPGPARRRIAVARDAERERRLAAEPMLDGRPGDPVAEVLRTGVPRVEPGRVVVALSARGRALGALAAGFDEGADARREDALALLEDLGRRAALALDNARLYAERDAIATTLQRSLLPPDLPWIPGARLAARYRASGEGIEMGGDFYDCFATGGGDWALVIGDVCGKGAEAAAVTALARYTLRASVLHTHRPAPVLHELNEALLRQGLDYRFCTVLYAAVKPGPEGCEVVVATGGHPLPFVLRAGGEVEQAGSPGTLLGIVPEPDITEERIMLRDGDSLVLYTDGVVEASPTDGALATEQLEALLRTCDGHDPGAIAEAVEREALAVQDGRLRDDVAVVVLRAAPFDVPGPGVAQPA